MMDTQTRKPSYKLPPIPYQNRIDQALDELALMSPEEFFQTLVHAGIYTPEGQLTEPYVNDEPSACRPTD